MMWHWNSLWAPAPGDPPAIDDPALWRSPWSAEQSIALQARTWDALLSTSRSWWSFWLAAWPLPSFPVAGEVVPPAGEPTSRPAAQRPATGKAATARPKSSANAGRKKPASRAQSARNH